MFSPKITAPYSSQLCCYFRKWLYHFSISQYSLISHAYEDKLLKTLNFNKPPHNTCQQLPLTLVLYNFMPVFRQCTQRMGTTPTYNTIISFLTNNHLKSVHNVNVYTFSLTRAIAMQNRQLQQDNQQSHLLTGIVGHR